MLDCVGLYSCHFFQTLNEQNLNTMLTDHGLVTRSYLKLKLKTSLVSLRGYGE